MLFHVSIAFVCVPSPRHPRSSRPTFHRALPTSEGLGVECPMLYFNQSKVLFANGPEKIILLLHSYCYMRIYFIRISRLKLAEYPENLKNKPGIEILKEDNFGC